MFKMQDLLARANLPWPPPQKPTYKINKPMLINGQIWCRITKWNKLHDIWCIQAWKVYDIDKRSYFFLRLIPNHPIHVVDRLSDPVALKYNIYFYDGNRNLVELNTTTLKYFRCATPSAPQLHISLSNLTYINTNRLVQDSKTGRWYSHLNQHLWISCCSGYMMKQIKYSEHFEDTQDKFVFVEDGDERKINCDFFGLQIAENSSAYDNYLFYSESQRNIFILDFLNGIFCDIDLSQFGVNESQKCHALIIEQYNNMLKMILFWFMLQNDVSDIHIPKDVYCLIELYHGDYYNLRLHLFDACIYDEEELRNYSFHKSISLGVVINEYSQTVDTLTKMRREAIEIGKKYEAEEEY